MPNLIHSMAVSLDGYVADAGGDFDWAAPDEELHRFHNERVGKLGAQLVGRRLYEVMRYWDTAADDPDASEVTLEFARVWAALPKLVFSRTLDRVEGNATLATGSIEEEVARLKRSTDRDIGVGGATLAAECARLGLIDEYEVFVNPVIVGGGTPFFPRREQRVDLELLETRTFGSRVVFLRYGRA
jgi:dihydrofolate reductase